MECLIDKAVNAKSSSELVSIIREIFSLTRIKNVVPDIVEGEDPPYIFKTIIDTEFYFLINWKRYAKANIRERKRQLIRELNKLFYAIYKSLNVSENIYKFLKEFGISLVAFTKVQNLAQQGKFGQKFTGTMSSMFAGMLGSILFNIIYDKTIERILDKTKAKMILYPRFYSKLGCPKSVMYVEHYSNYINEYVELMEFRLIKQLIAKLKDIESFGCKTLRFIYRIFTSIFGLRNPLATKLYKVVNKCR